MAKGINLPPDSWGLEMKLPRQPPMPTCRLINHRHVVRGRLVMLHIAGCRQVGRNQENLVIHGEAGTGAVAIQGVELQETLWGLPLQPWHVPAIDKAEAPLGHKLAHRRADVIILLIPPLGKESDFRINEFSVGVLQQGGYNCIQDVLDTCNLSSSRQT